MSIYGGGRHHRSIGTLECKKMLNTHTLNDCTHTCMYAYNIIMLIMWIHVLGALIIPFGTTYTKSAVN